MGEMQLATMAGPVRTTPSSPGDWNSEHPEISIAPQAGSPYSLKIKGNPTSPSFRKKGNSRRSLGPAMTCHILGTL